MLRPSISPGWWLTIGVVAILLLPALARDGMFMDGMLYAVVAYNLAHGTGTFWEPVFSPLGLAGLPTFHEHPPLGFAIQAFWFKMWGDAFWVERLWSLVTAVLNTAILAGIWRTLMCDRPALRPLAWWPVLLWIIIPVNFWSYRNNMHENSMSLFTGMALWSLVAGVQGRVTWLVACALAGAGVFLATFVKGLPGFFLLAAPVIMHLALGRPGRARALLGTLVAVVVCGGAYAVLLLSEEARQSLGTYVNERLLRRIAEKPTVDSHFWIVPRLLSELLPSLLVAGTLLALGRRRALDGHGLGRWALALALIGLCGVLPLMLTKVQKAFYFTPALGPLALALAVVSAPALAFFLGRLGPALQRGVSIFGILLTAMAVVLAIAGWGRPGRDAEKLHDVALIGREVPRGALIGAQPELWEEWDLQCYLLRNHHIGIDPGRSAHTFYLGLRGSPLPPDHVRMDLPLGTYTLAKRQGGGERE